MGDQATLGKDTAARKMGDAGKGSFEQSQDADERGEKASGPQIPEGGDTRWQEKLKDELAGKDAPKEGRTDAAGPGRGRF
jgi:hypothetical protein